MNRRTKYKLFRSLVGVLLIGGIGGILILHDIREKREVSGQIAEVQAEQQKADEIKTEQMNEIGSEEGRVKKTIEDFLLDTEKMDYRNPVLNMGYEYMSKPLAENAKKNDELQTKKIWNSVVRSKRIVNIENIQFKQIQFPSETVVDVTFSFDQSHVVDNQLKLKNQFDCDVRLEKNEMGSWIFSYISSKMNNSKKY